MVRFWGIPPTLEEAEPGRDEGSSSVLMEFVSGVNARMFSRSMPKDINQYHMLYVLTFIDKFEMQCYLIFLNKTSTAGISTFITISACCFQWCLTHSFPGY